MAYLPLSTANLPDPVIDPAQGSSPEDYFDIDIYTGNGTTNSRSNFTFQPDMLWFKSRSNATSWNQYTVLQGTNYLLSDQTSAEQTASNGFVSFDNDGFTLDGSGGGGEVNVNLRTYCAWGWKANGSGVSNTDGSITSTVSANTTSGFSIVSWTGTETTGQSFGHGLTQNPEMVLVKQTNSDILWIVYHKDLSTPETKYLRLNGTEAEATTSSAWDGKNPDSDVIYVGANSATNGDGDSHIAYCFHSVEGFSKFGSYTGTGSSRQFVYTGFRPAFILCKNTSGTGNWILHDTKRDPYNLMIANLYPNSSSAEGNTNMVDALSNGFEVAADFFGDNNASGSTYIYMAFAENPFKYSNAR